MFQTTEISIAFRARVKKINYPEEIITMIIGKAPRDKNMIKIIVGDLYVNTHTLSIKKKNKRIFYLTLFLSTPNIILWIPNLEETPDQTVISLIKGDISSNPTGEHIFIKSLECIGVIYPV